VGRRPERDTVAVGERDTRKETVWTVYTHVTLSLKEGGKFTDLSKTHPKNTIIALAQQKCKPMEACQPKFLAPGDCIFRVFV